MSSLPDRKSLGTDATEEQIAEAIANKSPQIHVPIPVNTIWFAPRTRACPPDLNVDEKLSTALCCSLAVVAKRIKDGRIYLRELDSELRRAIELLSPVFETDDDDKTPEFKGLSVDESDEGELFGMYRSSPRAAQLITTCIGTNMDMHFPMTDH